MSLYKYLTRVQLSPTPVFTGSIFETGYNNTGQLGSGNVANKSSPTQLGSSSWSQIAAGVSHTSAIRSNGTLWTWGLGTSGQLGDSTLISKSSPVQVGTSSWSLVSVGDLHTLAIKADGSLWGWGDNAQGQVGIAYENIYSWTQLATGWGGFLGVRTDGTLWAWGNNSNGQLGDSTIVAKSSPIQIGAGTNWSKVSIGYYNSIALKSDGSLWTWGQNTYGQVGNNTVADKSSPIQIGTSSWTQISNGANHTAAIRADGTLWTWGYNNYGQLGNTFFIPQYSWTQIATSRLGNHTLAVRADGTLWTWGYNNYGQLGDGTTVSKSSPVQIGSGNNWSKINAFGHTSIAIKSDGTMWSWGYNGNGELGDGTQTNRNSPVQIGSGTNWSQIIGGPGWSGTNNFALAIKTDGSLWSWGYNAYGQLGDNTRTNKSSPVLIGTSSWSQISTSNFHVLAIRSDGKLFAWGGGSNSTGDAGSPQGLLGDNANIDRSSPVQIGTSSWIAVAAAVGGGYDGTGAASAAVRSDGTLWTWGVNTWRSAQYRLGDTSGRRSSPVQVGTDTDWSTVNLGFAFHYGVKTDGSIWGWGGATYAGGIGYFFSGNRITLQPSPQKIYDSGVFSKVSLGCDSSSWNVGDWLLAIRADGLLVGVGKNEQGELGNGWATSWTAPATDISITVPDNRYNMGNKSSPCQVGTATNWTQIRCGDQQTIALKSDGSLWMWGYNVYGQLGDSTIISKSSPIQIGTSSWSQISTGGGHTSAIKADGTLWQWGYNAQGQIGLISTGVIYSWTQVSTGTYNGVLGIRSDGTLWGWGINTNGTIGDGTATLRVSPSQVGSLSNWSQVSAGASVTSAIKTDGSLWSWGYDSLNLGFVTPAFAYTQYSWTQISAGYYYTLAIRSDGKLFAWGNNSSNQLGDGTNVNRSSPIQIGTSSWSQIATGGPSAIAVNFAIRTDGALFAWGDNTYGQLGDGTNIVKLTPTQVSTNSWSQITTSGSHVMAIRSDNTLWSWGNNNGGQLGININGGSVNSPVQVGTSFTILDSSTGAIKINSVGGVLTSNVKPFSTGSSLNFAGNGYLITDNAANNASLVIGNNDFTIEFWYNTNTIDAQRILFDQRAQGVNGPYPTVYQSGANKIIYYVNGGDRITSVTSVNSDTWYHIAVSRSGSSTKLFVNGVQEGSTYTDTTLYINGYNRPAIGVNGTTLTDNFTNGYMSNIRLVKGTAVYTANFTPPTSPLTAITNTSLLINSYSTSTPTATSWSKIAAGVSQSAAIKSDGTLWMWGTDNSGSLGGDRWTARTVYSWSQIATGYGTTLAIRSDGKLFSWGYNDQANIGDGTQDSNNRKSSPVQIGTSSWSQVATAQYHSLAIRADGTLWSWGVNGQGQCGQGNSIGYSSPVQIGTSSWTQIDAGEQFSVGIKADGTLWTWGYNPNGQLGDGTTASKSSPIQVGTSSWSLVSAGEHVITAISSTGKLFTWGQNVFGQLGDGTTVNKSSPVQIGVSSWTQVSVGYSHAAAIRSDGTLWAWGSNENGKLGTSSDLTIHRSSPVQIGTDTNWTQIKTRIHSSIGLKSDGSLWAWGYNGSGELGGNYPYNTIINYPVKVDNSSWTKIGSGKTNQWNMAIRSNGLLFGWGYNAWGQLGIDTTVSRTSGPVQIPDNTLLNRSSPVQVGTSSWSQIYAHATQATMAAIRADGTLWTWGNNANGQLGDGTTNPKSSPTQIGSQTDWNQVTINSAYAITVARKTDGSLWTWGTDDNSNGFLGVDGSSIAKSSPVQVFSHASWSNVSAGYDHFIYTQTDGSLWARGGNTYGQYGSNNTLGYWNLNNPYSYTLVSAAANYLVLSRSSPVQVGTSSWSSISTGLNHTLALKSDGKLFAWGENAAGQLGDGTFINKSSPVQIGTSSWTKIAAGSLYSTAIRSDGALFTWGDNNNTKLGYATYDGGIKSWTQIGFNSNGALAIRADGTLWAWGYNVYGQLGQGHITNRSSPVQIGTSSWSMVSSSYDYMSMAIRSDGTLWTWGRNDYGQIGDGTTINRSIPVQVGSANNWSKITTSGYSSFAIKTDGSLWAWGYNVDGRLGNISEFILDSSANYSWTQIAASRFMTFAIRSDGTLWGTGINDYGQQLYAPRYYRGDNYQDSMVQFGTSSFTQVDSGWAHVMAIAIDGSLWGWGYGQQGQIGTGTPGNYYIMTKVGKSSWSQVSAGGTQSGPGVNDLGSTMAIRADGTLWAWGYNAGGEVGNGTVVSQSSPVQIGTSSWTSISMGSNSAAAIRADGTLWAWGYNFGGELGQNNIIPRSSPVQIGAGTNWSKVSVGAAYTLALKTDGSLWAWGYNNFGQLGFNDIISRSSPVQVGLSSWTNINAGYYTASAIKADGTFWTWGYNGTYQVDATATNKSSPVQVGSNTNWSQIANGENHSAALDSNGIVYTWGTNNYGQTGISTAYTNYRPSKLGVYSAYVNRSSPTQVGTSSWSQVSSFYNSTIAIRSDNTLWAWGVNDNGQLGDNTIINKSSPVQIGTSSWSQISAGTSTMTAIKADGTLWAWGYNLLYGQVGDNTLLNRSSPVQIGTTSSWSQVSMGIWMAAAVKLDGSIWVWGRDQEGYQQALYNVNKNYSSPVQIGQGGNNTVWSKVYMGGNFAALAIRSDGLLFGWGLNNYGQLGIPVYPAYRMVSVGNNSYYTPMNSPVQVGTSSWSMVSASDSHTMAIRSDGLLFGWGGNVAGQIGDNSYIEKSSPVQIGTKTWSKVYAGYQRTTAIDTAGVTYGWGNNTANVLLDNGPTTIVPTIRSYENWTSISPEISAAWLTAAIKSDGTLWLAGTNDQGQLAQGNTTTPIQAEDGSNYPLLKLGIIKQLNSRSSPVQIGTSSWTQVSSVQNQTLGIKADGTLWSWGQNNYGQLGILSVTGILETNYRSSPVQIGTESSWSKIVMGYLAAGAIRTNGKAQIWGYGGAGEQADRRTANRLPHELGNFYWTTYSSPVQIGSGSWIKISAGQYENMAINSANNLFSWGRNVNFGLGDGTNFSRSSPVQVGTSSWTMATIKQNGTTTGAAAGITTDNKLFAWGGYNNYGQQLTKNSGSVYSWTQISQGVNNGAAIRSDGSLWTWGVNNTYGQLGISLVSPTKISPVQVGTSSWTQVAVGLSYVTAIRADGTLWTWGGNQSGNLGLNLSTTDQRSSPTQIGSANNWSSVVNGYNHTLATKTDGTLWTWGNNSSGQLGNGLVAYKSSPVQIGSSSWLLVDAYGNNSAAIRVDGALFTWGDNSYAQLGQMTYSGDPQSWSQIASGEQFVTAIKSDGTLWYWGLNTSGYNGDPARVARNSPVLIDSRSWSKIGSGSQFSVGLRSDGTIWSFGQNQVGQLGLSHTLNPVYSPTQIGSANTWTNIAVGYDHTLALRSDGALFTWGQNTSGQLGDLTAVAKSSPVQIGTSSWTFIVSGYLNSSAIRSDGALFTWGYNAFGSIGDSTVTNKSSPVQVGTSSWTQVANVYSGTRAIKADGTLWAWGSNASGELGLGNVILRSSPVQVGTNTNWIEVSGGTNFSLYRDSSNNLYGTGLNTSGQLGDNTLINKSSPVQIGAGTNWAKLFKSCAHTVNNGYAITSTGSIFVWGINTDSRAGIGTTNTTNLSSPVQIGANYFWDHRSSPVQVGTSSWSQVAVGLSNAAAIRADGTLWTWGNNPNGELGLNDRINRSSPVQVGANTNWTQITIGDGQTYAIDNTGNLFAWGVNTDGRLGSNDLISRSNPTQVGAFVQTNVANLSVPVNYSGTPLSSPNTPLTDGTGSLLGAGSWLYTAPSTNYILNTDFTLEYWFYSTASGPTYEDQFNIGTMSGGSGNGIGVRLNNSDSVYLNGGFNGYLNDLLTYAPVGTWNHLAISRTGTIIKIFVNGTQRSSFTFTATLNSTGAAIYLFYSPDEARGFPGYLTNFRLINGTGLYSTDFTPTKTKLTAVANTVFLFTGPTYDSYKWSKVDSISTNTLAINTANTLATWGLSTNGSLLEGNFAIQRQIAIVGNKEVFITSETPNQILTSNTWKSVAIDYEGYSKSAIKSDGTLWTWGLNDAGQLGIGDAISRSSPVQVGVYGWSSVQMGYRHAVALRDNNYLFTWGNNANGQLGDGTVTNRNSPVIIGGAIANNQYQLIATGSVYNNFFLK